MIRQCRLVSLALASAMIVATWSNMALRASADDIFRSGSEAKPEAIVAFLEGPAWHPNGNVFFSDVENNRILRRDVTGAVHTYRTPSGRANGLAFDSMRRLVACEGGREGGNRRVTRTENNGTITVLASQYKGRLFNSPNDLVIDSHDRIFFTDPRYGDRSDLEMLDEHGEPIEGVYRIDPDGTVTRILKSEVQRPNGIAISPDGQYLYVVDNNNGTPDGNRKIWRFTLTEAGDIEPNSQHELYDFGRGRGGDGMAVDIEGRLYIAAGTNVPNMPLETADNKAGIYVLSPAGELLAFMPVLEDMVTNCAFGDPDLKTLYITAGHKLWSVPVTTAGYLPCAQRPTP